ncbi:glycosyltransferase family 4 protein [Pseudonocardia hydrocarbonoxydans]|uniref:Glycosyl transferase n=1 Tax=Pseudonocardia hydrocarbonoxydans TaxID=76726 RepID=A0A4Y3WKN3_9PSEU|nr:glycosyltransferase family 4 protein [Pseudonocardia hydrocarbonoxydans]GEC19335.1 glycosyl transferase [Pseudonocardia hydrocarbonoxydans]
MNGTVHVVVPGDVDDTGRPSGGNSYDRRVIAGMRAAGVRVEQVAVDGRWPRPSVPERGALQRTLAALPTGSTVLIDGLVACGVPDVVVPQARRLDVVVLVHLPLGDEVGTADLAHREREALHAAATVVATSSWTARRLREQHDLGHVEVVTPGVDPAPVASGTDGAGRLLCVGSVTPTKGQDLLVEALADVTEHPWTCDLVGPLGRAPAHVADVRAAIARHGLDGRIRLPGPLVGAPLAAAFGAADLLVLPSRVEAYGMVVTEALARGIPVLAADVGGVRSALGGTGLLVPPADAVALAAGLRRWLGRADLRAELRAGALARRGELTGWEVTSRCLVTILHRVRSGTPA